MGGQWRYRERVAYKLVPAEDVSRLVNTFTFDLRRAWDLRMNLLIDDPLPREGDGFSIIPLENQFGDRFLSLVVDEFPFVVNFSVYPWPRDEDNPLGFEGIVNVFTLTGT